MATDHDAPDDYVVLVAGVGRVDLGEYAKITARSHGVGRFQISATGGPGERLHGPRVVTVGSAVYSKLVKAGAMAPVRRAWAKPKGRTLWRAAGDDGRR